MRSYFQGNLIRGQAATSGREESRRLGLGAAGPVGGGVQRWACRGVGAFLLPASWKAQLPWIRILNLSSALHLGVGGLTRASVSSF